MVKQISIKDLEERIMGKREDINFEIDGEKYHCPGRPYALFPPGSDVEVGFKKYIIPLSSENYGFEDDQLNESLENLAKMINDSVAYDVESILNNEKIPEKFKEALRDFEYKPNGNETKKGICTDAGDDIRRSLENIAAPSLRYLRVSSSNKIASHDTTVVFDINTGDWVVLNSKSPFKTFNLAKKEDLQELGYPYCNSKGLQEIYLE